MNWIQVTVEFFQCNTIRSYDDPINYNKNIYSGLDGLHKVICLKAMLNHHVPSDFKILAISSEWLSK